MGMSPALIDRLIVLYRTDDICCGRCGIARTSDVFFTQCRIEERGVLGING